MAGSKTKKADVPKWSGPASAAAAVVAELNGTYGAGTIVLGSEIREDLDRRVTTGSEWFDWTLGGGFRTNQWHEIVGDPSSGKTSTILKAVAANQALDENFLAVWVAAEGLDRRWAIQLGVDVDRLLVIDRNEMEPVLQIILRLSKSATVDMIVVDSLPALVPLQENERDVDEDLVALPARRLAQFFRMNGHAMRRSLVEAQRPITGILINQWREKIGVMFGDNRNAPGGRAKEYFCATRTDLSRGDWIEDDERKLVIKRDHAGSDHTIRRQVKVGHEIRFTNQKNKTGPPRREGIVDFYFTDGIVDGEQFRAGDYDLAREIVLLARGLGVLFYKGKWQDSAGAYEWKNEGQMMDAIFDNTTIFEHIVKLVRAET